MRKEARRHLEVVTDTRTVGASGTFFPYVCIFTPREPERWPSPRPTRTVWVGSLSPLPGRVRAVRSKEEETVATPVVLTPG